MFLFFLSSGLFLGWSLGANDAAWSRSQWDPGKIGRS